VSQFQELVKRFKTLDEAKSSEAPLTSQPPPSPEDGAA